MFFARQTIRNQLLPSDHFFCAVKILDAAGFWTGPESPKARCGRNGSSLGECQVEGVPEPRRSEFLNVVIGTFDEDHVFPADLILEAKEVLVPLHFTVRLLPLRIALAVASIVAK